MAPPAINKRKLDAAISQPKSTRPPKKPRKKQTHYRSPSPSPSSASSASQDFAPISLADSSSSSDASPASDAEISPTASPSQTRDTSTQASSSASNSDSDTNSSASETSNPNKRRVSKRNDPSAFAASISAILNTKLTTSKRADPVLARSASAAEASASISNCRLEAKAKRKLKEEKKSSLEKGRVRDVLLGTDAPKTGAEGVGREGKGAGVGESVGDMQEQEKRLRKTAQRGVVKLFNAVRAAQVKGEEAARERRGGGRQAREERIKEMGREGFLELVAGGGGTKGGGVEG